jgi:hypothetical protein
MDRHLEHLQGVRLARIHLEAPLLGYLQIARLERQALAGRLEALHLEHFYDARQVVLGLDQVLLEARQLEHLRTAL